MSDNLGYCFVVHLLTAQATEKMLLVPGNVRFTPIRNNGEFCVKAFVCYTENPEAHLQKLKESGHVSHWKMVE